MKIKRILSLALIGSMLFSVPVMAEESEGTANVDSENLSLESVEFDVVEPISLEREQVSELFADEDGIQPYTTEPDDCEPNDTPATAYPYSQVETLTTELTGINQLYTLGMKHAGFDSETDEDWYTVTLTADETYFVDLRNTGKLNWFIELYYVNSDGSGYYYTTNPAENSVYLDVPEKYFYFTAEDTGTYYIRVSSGDDWADEMHYFFYVGPAIQTFNIVDMPTYGGVNLFGNTSYRTYTFDMSNQVPSQTSIVSLSITDNFPQGNACTEVDKYLSAGGSIYYNTSGTGSGTINNIRGASLGQLWTIGGKCATNSHYTYWSAHLNGSFQCIMEPYPGNELSF